MTNVLQLSNKIMARRIFLLNLLRSDTFVVIITR